MSDALYLPLREREEAALDLCAAALQELLLCMENQVSDYRKTEARRKARRALRAAETLRRRTT